MTGDCTVQYSRLDGSWSRGLVYRSGLARGAYNIIRLERTFRAEALAANELSDQQEYKSLPNSIVRMDCFIK
jgi:hypothetical protein